MCARTKVKGIWAISKENERKDQKDQNENSNNRRSGSTLKNYDFAHVLFRSNRHSDDDDCCWRVCCVHVLRDNCIPLIFPTEFYSFLSHFGVVVARFEFVCVRHNVRMHKSLNGIKCDDKQFIFYSVLILYWYSMRANDTDLYSSCACVWTPETRRRHNKRIELCTTEKRHERSFKNENDDDASVASFCLCRICAVCGLSIDAFSMCLLSYRHYFPFAMNSHTHMCARCTLCNAIK